MSTSTVIVTDTIAITVAVPISALVAITVNLAVVDLDGETTPSCELRPQYLQLIRDKSHVVLQHRAFSIDR